MTNVTEGSQRPVRYFEDYVPGLAVDCGTFTIGEAEIIAFAKEYDPQPFHVDPAAAAAGPVGGLIASGWQTASLTMRLLVEHFVSGETALGAAGVDEMRWPRRYDQATRCGSAPPSWTRGARAASGTGGSCARSPRSRTRMVRSS